MENIGRVNDFDKKFLPRFKKKHPEWFGLSAQIPVPRVDTASKAAGPEDWDAEEPAKDAAPPEEIS
jgi:hypothetical protein